MSETPSPQPENFHATDKTDTQPVYDWTEESSASGLTDKELSAAKVYEDESTMPAGAYALTPNGYQAISPDQTDGAQYYLKHDGSDQLVKVTDRRHVDTDRSSILSGEYLDQAAEKKKLAEEAANEPMAKLEAANKLAAERRERLRQEGVERAKQGIAEAYGDQATPQTANSDQPATHIRRREQPKHPESSPAPSGLTRLRQRLKSLRRK